MRNENNLDLQDLWQDQKSEDIRMSVEQLRLRAGKFEKTIFWRNAREYVAALIVVLYFAYELLKWPNVLTGIGFGLIIAGMLYMMWQLHRKGSSRTMPAELASAAGLDFYRRELERQRDLVQGVWWWYLAPLVPGLVVIFVAMALTNPHHLPHHYWFLAGYGLVVALAFIFVWKLNERAARRLERCINELDDLKGGR
jgi:Flp pilus assembly protein TadB